MDRAAVVVDNVSKSFGAIHALTQVSLQVPQATVLGLLGPNGAGKTTLVRILATLLKPDSGRAEVAGFDVVGDAARLRTIIGLAGQYAAVDESLTGRENLRLVGRLYHLGRAEAARRADDLLERFDLTGAGNRQVKTYSGGMRRRLDLGASLVGRPQVLFLDEPTTGLDPRSRIGLWEVIRRLVEDGTTLLLTTQYLEEADRLTDSIAVIDGRVIAEGTSEELKSRVGGEVLELTVTEPGSVGAAESALGGLGSGGAKLDRHRGVITVPVGSDATVLAEAVRRLDAAHIAISDLALRRPTLDDVFLALTGQATTTVTDDDSNEDASAGRRRGRRARRSAA